MNGARASHRAPLAFTARADPRDTAVWARAVFVDRDGVLNEGVPDPESGLLESPLTPGDVRLLPGVGDALVSLKDAGYALACVSNQPAAAKGKITVSEVLAVHERVLELLAADGVRLNAWRLCIHHPDGTVGELSGYCDCRKPAPGMLRDAGERLGVDLASSWMVGDTDADVAAGRSAGCSTALIQYPGSAHKRAGVAGADLLATDLPDAASQLLDHPSG